MQAVILAGGRGTRLKSLTQDTPKPLIPIGEKPVLEHQIKLLAKNGIRDIWLLLGYRAEQIKDYFKNGNAWGVNIHYHVESGPLGTAGALTAIAEHLTDDFLVLSGDILINMDLDRFANFHRSKKDSIGTVIVQPSDHPFESDHVVLDEKNRITELIVRPHKPDSLFRNLSVASGYIFSPQIFKYIPTTHKTNIEKDIFPVLLEKNIPLYAYNTPEYLQDIGSPELLQKARRDHASGKAGALNFKNKLPAVFLDRDGVINPEREGYVTHHTHFSTYPDVPEAIRLLNDAGFLVVVVTNQACVALGLAREADIEDIHKKMDQELAASGGIVNAVYYCPHRHESKGLPNERPELITQCTCRKPEAGLIEQAVSDLNIDLENSFFIGDKTTDAAASKKVGMRFIGVKTGHALADGQCPLPELLQVYPDLHAAALYVTERHHE